MEELRDFRNFVFLANKVLRHQDSEFQFDIADYLATGPKRRGVTAMRGAGKSVLTAALVAWLLYWNRDTKILVVSGAAAKAREFIRLVRNLIDSMDCLADLRPRFGDLDGADKFDVSGLTVITKDPSVSAYGMGSHKTGAHADVIIADDVETQENSQSQNARDLLREQIREFEDILNPGGQIIFLGTPQSEESIYNDLAEHYIFRRWPARAPDSNDERACRFLAPWILDRLVSGLLKPGDPTNPERMGELFLIEKEARQGPTRFAMQMLLDTTLADKDRYPLKLSNFIVFPVRGGTVPKKLVWGTSKELKIPNPGLSGDRFYEPIFYDPEFLEYGAVRMFIDPAGSGADEVGYAVAADLNGYVFVLAAGGLPGGHDDATLNKLALIAKRFDVKEIVVESNFGDGTYEKLLAPVVNRVSGRTGISGRSAGRTQKELRIIDTLEPIMANHRLVVDLDVAKDTSLMEQVSHIQRSRGSLRHDDRIDALAGVVGLFTERLSLDVDQVIKDREDAARNQADKEFMASWNNPRASRVFLGHPSEAPGGSQRPGWRNTRWKDKTPR